MLSLKINNINIILPRGSTIFQACLKLGITLPSFCYHEKLNIAGNCRMCLVEIEKNLKPITACVYPISNGLNIYTDTPLVKKARENILEFLLLNHPLDCPICDRGGECDLQDQTFLFGKNSSRFFFKKRLIENKNYSPFIKTIMNRCIHCTRCIRYATEILNLPFYGTILRGNSIEISTYLFQIFKHEMSGNVIDLCPVGALTAKPYTFRGRPWELDSYESIDIFDSFGAEIRIDYKNLNIVRILPSITKSYNQEWISDRIRFSYDTLENNRILFFFKKIKKKIIKQSFFQFESKILLEERQYNYLNKLYKNRYKFLSTYYFFFGSLISHKFLINFKIFNYLYLFTKNKIFTYSLIDSRNFFLLKNFNNIYEQNIILINTQYKEIIPNFNLELIKLFQNFKNKFFFNGLALSTPFLKSFYINLYFQKNFYNKLLIHIKKESVFFLYHIQNYIRIDFYNHILYLTYLNLILFNQNQINLTFTIANQIIKSELNLQLNYNWFFYQNNFLKKNYTKIFNFNNNFLQLNQNITKTFYFGHHLPINNKIYQYCIPIKIFFEENDFFINSFGFFKNYYSKFKKIKNILSLNIIFNNFLFLYKKKYNQKKYFFSKKLIESSIIYNNLNVTFQKKYKCFLNIQPFEISNSSQINIITKSSFNLLKSFSLNYLKSNFI
jgi:hypothetical protein